MPLYVCFAFLSIQWGILEVFCWPSHTLKNLRKSSVVFSGTGSAGQRWVFLGDGMECAMILHWHRRQSYTGNGCLWMAQSPSLCALWHAFWRRTSVVVFRWLQSTQVPRGFWQFLWCQNPPARAQFYIFQNRACSCGLEPRKWKVRFRRLGPPSEDRCNIQSTRELYLLQPHSIRVQRPFNSSSSSSWESSSII